jgi:hypothetical protein
MHTGAANARQCSRRWAAFLAEQPCMRKYIEAGLGQLVEKWQQDFRDGCSAGAYRNIRQDVSIMVTVQSIPDMTIKVDGQSVSIKAAGPLRLTGEVHGRTAALPRN